MTDFLALVFYAFAGIGVHARTTTGNDAGLSRGEAVMASIVWPLFLGYLIAHNTIAAEREATKTSAEEQ